MSSYASIFAAIALISPRASLDGARCSGLPETGAVLFVRAAHVLVCCRTQFTSAAITSLPSVAGKSQVSPPACTRNDRFVLSRSNRGMGSLISIVRLLLVVAMAARWRKPSSPVRIVTRSLCPETKSQVGFANPTANETADRPNS